MRNRLLIVLLVAVACGGKSMVQPDAPVGRDAPADTRSPDSPLPDAPPSEADVALGSGGANAILWDAASSTLYLTDAKADALLAYTGGSAVTTVATLPAESAGISLGGMLKLADGSIVVANFGFGSQGTLFQVAAGSGSGTALTGLDGTRRRIGLASDGAGVLYTSYFTGGGGASPAGGVSRVMIGAGSASETEIAGSSTSAGFKKIVGVAATPNALFVSDQTQSMIFKVDLAGSNAVSALASVPSADLLYMLPDGDLLTGGGSAITRITQTGTVSTVSLPGTTFSDVRGIAYDPVGHRLFVVDHSTTVGVGDRLVIDAFTPRTGSGLPVRGAVPHPVMALRRRITELWCRGVTRE